MKFSIIRKFTFKLTIAVVLISCMISIAHSTKKSVKAGTLVVNIYFFYNQLNPHKFSWKRIKQNLNSKTKL